MTRALYSLASSVARPVRRRLGDRGRLDPQRGAGAGARRSRSGPRPTPRTTAARSPLGSRPTCSMTAIVPTAAYLPSRRGTTRTLRSTLLAPRRPRPGCPAASSRTGTTMPGSTTESASGSTGSFSVSVMPGSTLTPLNAFQRSSKSARANTGSLSRARSTLRTSPTSDPSWARTRQTRPSESVGTRRRVRADGGPRAARALPAQAVDHFRAAQPSRQVPGQRELECRDAAADRRPPGPPPPRRRPAPASPRAARSA